ncbi:MAG TPA: ABC transporter substrate-binding protein [Candidatus Methylomirabilis sp.]|nr:ABC transporter substrate-binding protein [Candidatus Methylomirabilis sp.]
MSHRASSSLAVIVAVLMLAAVTIAPVAAAPSGQMTWGIHISLAPTWFDPAETPSLVTPFMVLYALHDALVKPMPGTPQGKSLAEAWSASKDGLVYEFTLRKGVTFHNGDPVTAEDVKFSFERYRGSASKLLKERVASVEVVDRQKVRFRLQKPWLDFMTFFATPATGAAWIVPKKYVEKVGDEGFKRAPIGAGPYKFVSFKPGVELVLEAYEGYWRKPPAVKTLVFRVIPDESTRLAALKRGEVDIAYSITGALAEELKQTKGLTLTPTYFTFTTWLLFTEQWDAKSPWHDQRVRLAANLAIDRQAINQAAYLGLSKPALSFVPSGLDYFWAPPAYPYDPVKAKQLLADAGYPNGFDAGDFSGEMIYGSAIGEPVTNFLRAAGIRTRLRLMERAAYYKEYSEKKLHGVLLTGSGAPGNAATRIDSYAVTGGPYVYGTYPEIDGLFSEQVNEQNPRVRTQILHKIQQILHDRVMFGPVLEPAFLNGVGSRVGNSGLGAIANFPYSAPYEDLALKPK